MSGRVIVPSEIKQQAQSTRKVLEVYQTAINDVMRVLQNTIDDNTLESDALTALKTQMQSHKQVLKGVCCAISNGITDSITLYHNAGSEYLDEDSILFKLKVLKKLNSTYNTFIESYRNLLKNPVYAEVFGAWAQCEIVKYSMLIYLNDRQITAYNKKLAAIEAIDSATRNLYSTDLSKYIMQGVNALNNSWTGEKYVAVLGGEWMDYLKKAWEKYEDDGTTIELGDPNFVTIVDDDGNVIGYGGDQGWYVGSDLDYVNNHGCGLMAMANVILYMRGVTTITKDDYMKFVAELMKKHKLIGVQLDTANSGLLTPYIGNVLEEELGKEYNIKDFKWNMSGDRLELIKQTLEKDVPVILQIGQGNKSLKLNFYKHDEATGDYNIDNNVNDHYVTVTGVVEYENPETGEKSTMIRISSWGKEYYIDYDEYLKFIEDSSDGTIDAIYENVYNNIYYVERD